MFLVFMEVLIEKRIFIIDKYYVISITSTVMRHGGFSRCKIHHILKYQFDSFR